MFSPSRWSVFPFIKRFCLPRLWKVKRFFPDGCEVGDSDVVVEGPDVEFTSLSFCFSAG